MKTRKYYTVLFIISFILFLFFRLPYRNFIYSKHLFDFYIADTAPNFFVIFLFVFLKKINNDAKISNFHLVLFSFIGIVIYEVFIQSYFKYATIDYKDILASLLASLIVFFIIKHKDNN